MTRNADFANAAPLMSNESLRDIVAYAETGRATKRCATIAKQVLRQREAAGADWLALDEEPAA